MGRKLVLGSRFLLRSLAGLISPSGKRYDRNRIKRNKLKRRTKGESMFSSSSILQIRNNSFRRSFKLSRQSRRKTYCKTLYFRFIKKQNSIFSYSSIRVLIKLRLCYNFERRKSIVYTNSFSFSLLPSVFF